ncbi:MAG: hypothetical protein U1F61_31325 [Opitutaceae bacterium]
MKTLKFTLAAALAAVSAFISVKAAEAVLSPRAAANVPRVVRSAGHTGHTTDADTRSVTGCSGGHSTHPDTAASSPANDADAHCKNAKKGEGRKPCCS